jgi:RNA polymerase sigma factor (sigma-70 family)
MDFWTHVLEVHQGWIRQVIRARTGEAQAVDDIYQQMALVACSQTTGLRDPARVGPWLHRLAVVMSARYQRSQVRDRRKITAASSFIERPFEPGGISWLIRSERLALIQQCIRKLQPRDREILLLKYDNRMSYRQIADLFGITEKAIDRRLQRARDKLRHQLALLGIHNNES